jgi:hypothetical protein
MNRRELMKLLTHSVTGLAAVAVGIKATEPVRPQPQRIVVSVSVDRNHFTQAMRLDCTGEQADAVLRNRGDDSSSCYIRESRIPKLG